MSVAPSFSASLKISSILETKLSFPTFVFGKKLKTVIILFFVSLNNMVTSCVWNMQYCYILCIVTCMLSLYIGQIVNGRTCGWLVYEFICTPLRLIHHITPYCTYTCPLTIGSVHSARCGASSLRCSACILATLYTFYPVCDAMMRAMCTLVSCHTWWHYVWYICHIFVICFHSLYVMSLVCSQFNTPIHLLKLVLN